MCRRALQSTGLPQAPTLRASVWHSQLGCKQFVLDGAALVIPWVKVHTVFFRLIHFSTAQVRAVQGWALIPPRNCCWLQGTLD
eukprot:1807777-Rhodomonas_salina.1